ncbi:hypothetical protein [Bradyrhizobium sp. USDA 3364]
MDRIDATAARADAPACPDGENVRATARAHRTIVICGDAAQVSAGFALALDAMDANAEVLMTSIKTRGGST